MKHIYQTMMAACVLTSVGSINAAADYWSVSVSEDPVAAAEIEAGKQYVFQSAASAKAGTAAYLSVMDSSTAHLALTTRAFSPLRRLTKK